MNFCLLMRKIKYKLVIILKKIIWKVEYGNQIMLGKNIVFREGLIINISNAGSVEIGENTFFNNYCSINSHGYIKIGSDCLFGESIKIYDHNHIFNTKKKINEESYNVGEVIIGNNCWIGSNVILLKGTQIGNNCTISAGCVIDGVVPDNTLVKRNNLMQSMEKIRRIEKSNEEDC